MAVARGWNYDTYTTSTGPADSVYYYTMDEDGNSRLINTPEHQHNHGANNIQWYAPQPQNSISVDGEEVMKFCGDVQIKVNGEWVSLNKMMTRVDKLEKIVENLYNMLPQWKIDMMDIDEDEEINDEVEHIDPDLFKI